MVDTMVDDITNNYEPQLVFIKLSKFVVYKPHDTSILHDGLETNKNEGYHLLALRGMDVTVVELSISKNTHAMPRKWSTTQFLDMPGLKTN